MGDSNGDGNIDKDEFENLIYCSLKIFCVKRNPDLPAPTKNQMQPFITRLIAELSTHIDKDDNGVIEREEFKGFGKYLTKEFTKLTTELKGNDSTNVKVD